MLHFVGAMIFMWGGMTHAQAIEPIYAAGSSLECTLLAQPPVAMAAAFRRISITGVLPVIGFVLPLAFQLVQFVYGDGSHEAVKKKSDEAASESNEQATKNQPLSSDAKSKSANQDGVEETSPTHSSRMSNGMGALQWAIVILFATFYASYAPDLYYAGAGTKACALTVVRPPSVLVNLVAWGFRASPCHHAFLRCCALPNLALSPAPPLVEDAEGSDAVQPVAILVCSILGLATGLAFYYTEHMMDS